MTRVRTLLPAAICGLALLSGAAAPGIAAAAIQERTSPVPASRPVLAVDNNAGAQSVNAAIARAQLASTGYAQATALFNRACTKGSGEAALKRATTVMRSADSHAEDARGLRSRGELEHLLRASVLERQGKVAVDGSKWLRVQARWQAAEAAMQVNAVKARDASRACAPFPRPTGPAPK